MKNIVFLTGEMHTGKTSLILRKIKPYAHQTGGFAVQRLFEDGECRAFCVKPFTPDLTPQASCTGNGEGIFIRKTADGWKADHEVFTAYALKYMQGSENKKLFVLDEIGGVELCSEAFTDALYKLIESGIAIIGVIKSYKSLKTMIKTLHTGGEIQAKRKELITFIKKHNGDIISFKNGKNAESAIERVLKNSF